jgi:hypothetical protein
LAQACHSRLCLAISRPACVTQQADLRDAGSKGFDVAEVLAVAISDLDLINAHQVSLRV